MDQKHLKARLVAAHGNLWRDELLLALLALELERGDLLLDLVAPSVLVLWPCSRHDPPRWIGDDTRYRCSDCRRAVLERRRLVTA